MLVDKFLQQGQKILGKSPTAKAWEGASDLTVNSQLASDYTNTLTQNKDLGWASFDFDKSRGMKENPWISKLDPMTPVYHQQGYVDDIKFDHIIDELRNATNPASGLPKSLQIEAKDLAKYSMPQAVERVDKINAWRASQKAEADSNRANNAATFTVKEYPEGVSWKELKRPEAKLPEGYTGKYDDSIDIEYKDTRDPELFREYRVFNKEGQEVFNTRAADIQHGKKPEDAAADYFMGPQLADALAYEGELAKHCVSNYCADVESGMSKIFSLRDKGVPQVTIEVKPQTAESYYNSLPSNERHELLDKAIAYQKEDYLPGVITVQALANYVKAQGIELLPSIAQIRGINNRAPAEKYLPMVHDFIKSGKWGEIKDLKNIGMVKSENGYITDAEAALIKKDKGMKRGGVVHLEKGGELIKKSTLEEDAMKYLKMLRVSGGGGKSDYGTNIGGRVGVAIPLSEGATIEPYLTGYAQKPAGMPTTGAVNSIGVNLRVPFAKGGVVSQDAMRMAVMDKQLRKRNG
jgi:hypothetical protein